MIFFFLPFHHSTPPKSCYKQCLSLKMTLTSRRLRLRLRFLYHFIPSTLLNQNYNSANKVYFRKKKQNKKNTQAKYYKISVRQICWHLSIRTGGLCFLFRSGFSSVLAWRSSQIAVVTIHSVHQLSVFFGLLGIFSEACWQISVNQSESINCRC